MSKFGTLKRRQMATALMSAAVAALAAPAFAQQSTVEGAVAAPDPKVQGDTGDIVVTARRSSENIQRVPISIQAFSQQQLTSQAIYSGYDLNKSVAGLTVAPSGGYAGQPSFSIRGRGLNSGAAAGSVETYFADVPLSGPFLAPGLPPQFFDLQNLQVLRGPQGTLFGRNTTGGAILLVPQAPTDRFGGYARAQGGNYSDFQFEGAVNVPILDDRIAARFAAFVWKRDGYQKAIGGIDQQTGAQLPNTTVNNQNQFDLRGTVRIRPNDWIENSTIVTYHWSEQRGSFGPGLLLKWSGCPAGTTFIGCRSVVGFDPATAQPSSLPAPGAGSLTIPLYTLNLKKPADKALAVLNTTIITLSDTLKIKNVFGYIHGSGYNGQAFDASGAGAYALDILLPPRPLKNDQYTNELQLQGSGFGNRLTWIVGGMADITRQPTGLATMPITSQTVSRAFVPGVTVPNSTVRQTFGAELLDSYSAFGSATFAVADRLKATAGLRRSWNEIRDYVVIAQPGFSGVILPQNYPSAPLKKHDNGNTYNVGLDYQASLDTLVYAGYRRGYKRGGFRANAPSLAQAAFEGEKVDSFSAGIKSQFQAGDVRVRLNVEGFYDLYKGQQVSYLTLVPAGIKGITTNVPKTTFRGIDVDLTADPADWLTFTGNYEFLDTFNGKWLDTSVAGKSQDLSDNPVPFAPRNKFSATARLHTELAENKGRVAFATTVNYQSVSYTSPYGDILPFAQQVPFGNLNQIALGAVSVPRYATLDFRLEWTEIAGSRFSVAANVNNATKRIYYPGNNFNITVGYLGYQYGTPRTITAELSYKF